MLEKGSWQKKSKQFENLYHKLDDVLKKESSRNIIDASKVNPLRDYSLLWKHSVTGLERSKRKCLLFKGLFPLQTTLFTIRVLKQIAHKVQNAPYFCQYFKAVGKKFMFLALQTQQTSVSLSILPQTKRSYLCLRLDNSMCFCTETNRHSHQTWSNKICSGTYLNFVTNLRTRQTLLKSRKKCPSFAQQLQDKV